MTTQPPWRWRFERAWIQGGGRWATLIGVALLLVVALGAALFAIRQAERARAEVDLRLSQARMSKPVIPKTVGTEAGDFSRSLGTGLPSAQVVQEIQRACSQAGVTLTTLQVQDRAATLEQLGRSEFSLALRGTYSSTKQVIKQIVERFPNTGVKRLRMRRVPGSTDIESALMLSLWSAPLLPPATTVDSAQVPR